MLATVLIILILVGYIALNLFLIKGYKNREKTIAIGITIILYVLVYVLYEVIVCQN